MYLHVCFRGASNESIEYTSPFIKDLDTFLGDALTQMFIEDEKKMGSLKEYEWKMKIYSMVRVKGKTIYRSHLKDCFNLLSIPLWKLVNYISPEGKKFCQIHVKSFFTCVSDYRLKFLAWNQQCDYPTHRFICQFIVRHIFVGAIRPRRSTYYRYGLDYLYFYWGRPYMILKYGKTRNPELRDIMTYHCQVILQLYFTDCLSTIISDFREMSSFIITSKGV